jgi:hypothetical protein
MSWGAFIGAVVTMNVVTFQNIHLKRQLEAIRDEQAMLHEKVMAMQADIRANGAKPAWRWLRW